MTTYLSATFTGADTAAGTVPNADTGQAFTQTISGGSGTAGWHVSSNTVTDNNTNNESFLTADSGLSDGTFSATLTATDSAHDGGLAIRVGGTTIGLNAIMLVADVGAYYVYQRSAGAYTNIGTLSITPTVGDLLTIVARGSSIKASVNGVSITTASSVGVTNTRVGFRVAGTTAGRTLAFGNLTATDVVPSNPYSVAVLADSPWGFWQQSETTGKKLADWSPNHNDMDIAYSAETLNQVGPFAAERAISWANATGYAKSVSNMTTNDATLEAWLYLAANPSGWATIIGCSASYLSATRDKILFVDSAGKVNFHFYPGTSTIITAPTALSLNTWHHVVASVGPAGAKVRVDKSTVVTNGATTSYTGSQYLWTRASGDNFSVTGAMQIAVPAFYLAQLTDARTDAHYDAAFARARRATIVASQAAQRASRW